MKKSLEAGELQPQPQLHNPRVRHNKLTLCFWVVVAVAFSGYQFASYVFSAPAPGPGINWSPCGDNIECGHLSVPLDYHDVGLGTANLAVARYRATNTSAPRLGTIFTNPGGPGGSGVNYVYRAGPRISGVVHGRYDIVSWDPRGVNESTPRVDCFNSQTAQDLYYVHTHQEMELESRNLTDPIDLAIFTAAVRRADAANAALAKLCIETSGEALRHVGTATVVRDMEYLSRVIEGEDALVNFWGFSYGTIVGSYFVNMFPDRVGRVVIDGVVDPDLWANSYSNEWVKYDYVDTDKAFEHFVRACQEAGPDRCALASDKSTAKSIATSIDKLISDLFDYPLPVDKANRPGALTSGMVKGQLFQSMYSPSTWPVLATNLAAALEGNGTALMNSVQDAVELNTSVRAKTASAITAVTCVDTPPFPANMDKNVVVQKNIDEQVLAYELTSKRFAGLEVDMCHYWTPREAERFTGPWNHTLSNQILIIGNTADPITPLANAKAVNQFLKNDSRLLIQDGSGHCSTAMASLCSGQVIRGYFLEGLLPPNGLVCPTDEVLFPPPANKTDWVGWITGDRELAENDQRLLQNLKALGEETRPFFMHRR